MNFTPTESESSNPANIPFYEDARAEDGWQGQRTGKSMNALKSELIASMSRLGGMVESIKEGKHFFDGEDRNGLQIMYVLERLGGEFSRARLDIVALPTQSNTKTARQNSVKMALYMVNIALSGAWYMQLLSPGYAALMPWVLDATGEKTITERWSESLLVGKLLPAGGDFEEGEIVS